MKHPCRQSGTPAARGIACVPGRPGGFLRSFGPWRPPPCNPWPRLPDTGFLRQDQVLAFVPVSRSTLWRRVRAHTFPEPVHLSERVTAWRVEDVRRWIAEQGR